MRAKVAVARVAVGLILTLLASGCGGGTSTITGTVKYLGRPLTNGQISFIGKDGKSASSTIGPDGKYTVTNAPTGSVTVTVLAYQTTGEAKLGSFTGEAKLGSKAPKTQPSMTSAVPPKYNDPATSGLQYTIDSGSKTIDIDLTD
jgi:hypothetical protein